MTHYPLATITLQSNVGYTVINNVGTLPTIYIDTTGGNINDSVFKCVCARGTQYTRSAQSPNGLVFVSN